MKITISLLLASSLFFIASTSYAGHIYQDFEPNNGSVTYGWSWNAQAGLSASGEPVHSGIRSWKVHSYDYWAGTGIASQTNTWNFPFRAQRNDRLVFWICAYPIGNPENNVGVRFFDNNLYSSGGVEVWTAKTAFYGRWTKLYLLFSQLPEDFNLEKVNKIQFVNYWPGTYYLDDITVVREDRAYQTFEPERRSGSTVEEYGWRWDDGDFVGFSEEDEPVSEGDHSWKLITYGRWGGTGIQSEDQKLSDGEQTFWHVDLNPAMNDRLIFWLCCLPSNGMDNNLGVQFYDHDAHFTDDTKVAVWPKTAAYPGSWVRMEVPYRDLPTSLNLDDINKLQFQHFWPGTYYIDKIVSTGTILKLEPKRLRDGMATWQAFLTTITYELQDSTVGPEGPWVRRYKGIRNLYAIPYLSRRWYRVRWEEAKTADNTIPYISEWSDAAEYAVPPILIKMSSLRNGIIKWTKIKQAYLYELQSASNEDGHWNRIYLGSYPALPLYASLGEWYRVRAIKTGNGGVIADATPWSTPRRYQQTEEFLKTDGAIIRDGNGFGSEITFRGVNLGGLFLIERWMTGIGDGDLPIVEDDWTVRKILAERFGKYWADTLLKAYEQAYINETDLNNLYAMGVNFVRLPIFYRMLQDDSGRWVRDPYGKIDFRPIDYIVELCADRGIYVLLDLHGAPGGQSDTAHTGRANYNRLFENSAVGEEFRKRTVAIWQAIAEHYKENPAVCGYDLLNEPIGAPDNQTLWSLYDRLYDAIREKDENHIIVMEGIWDWDTLPVPANMGWENVLYQFHYYLWDHDEDLDAHRAFIDQKVADAHIKQLLYNVPIMVGEFFCFSRSDIWEYYLGVFNREGWSWASWSHKYHNSPSEWGLYSHAYYDEALPKFRRTQADGSPGDSYKTLFKKLSKYDTISHHMPNKSLIALFKRYLSR